MSALLAGGDARGAVEAAKEIHKRLKSAHSETLLVEAYGARVRALFDSGRPAEGRALREMVRERYPGSSGRIKDIGSAPREASVEALVTPLADLALAPERRTAIESAVRRDVVDLNALAECAALPTEHPLRRSAEALRRALAAVSSGPVEEAALAEISRRDPLAPWKMLIRAIACYYRREDDACERCLQGIDADSAPARLVPALRAMLTGKGARKLKPAARSLCEQAGGGLEELRDALHGLDAAFISQHKTPILRQIQITTGLCRKTCPDLEELLRQKITIQAKALGLKTNAVKSAMGGPALKNATFWRLFASWAADPKRTRVFEACASWEEFRKQAVREEWFSNDSPEAAALYRHMAGLLERLPKEDFEGARTQFAREFAGFQHYYDDQPPEIRTAAREGVLDWYFLFPDNLYARACRIDPHPETFERWLRWAGRSRDSKAIDEVAEAWCKALPADSRPLLVLMESAERRAALKKAMKYLEEAESLDAVNPEVRRARLRLLVSSAIRHLKQGKVQLLQQDLSELQSLPQAREKDRPVFLLALAWACAVLWNDPAEAARYVAEARDLMSSEVAAVLAFGELAGQGGIDWQTRERYLPSELRLAAKESLAGAVSRACAWCLDLGFALALPDNWAPPLQEELGRQGSSTPPEQLRILGETALVTNLRELAYACSAAGLGQGGAGEARFLLLRARSLPGHDVERRNECIHVAVELARRQRDMALVDEALDLLRGPKPDWLGWIHSMGAAEASLSARQIEGVLKREKAALEYPPRGASLCYCPACRLERGEISYEEAHIEDAGARPATLEEVFDELLDVIGVTGRKKRNRRLGRR